jgi:NAD(P)-dependent dehydrogenase (short-subunit alcohol dehydrogenase family)
MSESLEGRGAVVTGGGRGIGAAIASALVEAGAGVVVTARSAHEIEAVAARLRERGARAWAVACDVSDEESVRSMAEAARGCIGAIDVLVNNAGVSGSAPFAKTPLAEWNRMLAINATGTFLCTRELAPAMLSRGWGRIVNVASMVGLEGGRYVAHYSAAKHAVIGFTRSVALELAGSGVTINAVCPGYVDTPMTEQTIANVEARAGLTRERALASVLATLDQAALLSADDVAAAVVALCRDADANGQTVVLGPGAKGS